MAENENNQKTSFNVELPQSVIESFARFLLPEIRKFYASKEGQREFNKWKSRQKDQ